MLKKMTYLFVVICMLLTLCTPLTALAAGEIQVPQRTAVKFYANKYSNNYWPKGSADFYSASYDYCTPFDPNSWYEYTLNVGADGEYKVSVYTSSDKKESVKFGASIDGGAETLAEIVPNGAKYDFTVAQTLGTFELTAGQHTLKIRAAGPSTYHFSSIEIEEVIDPSTINNFTKTEGPYRKVTLPSRIKAEDYDIAVGFHSNNGKNDGRLYRTGDNEPMDIYKTSDDDLYLALEQGEYVTYTFTAPETATYKFFMTVDGGGTFKATFDDAPYGLEYVTRTKKFEQTRPVDIYLEAGTHKVKIECTEQLFNSEANRAEIDELCFEESATPKEEALTIESFNEPVGSVIPADEVNFDLLDAPNAVYKDIYVAENGNDSADGSKGAPFKSFERVLKELEVLTPNMTGDIVVHFAQGYYELKEKATLTKAHSGKNGFNVRFEGEEGEEKPVISGGERITGWEKDGQYLWKAPVKDKEVVRNLYVNDVRATRARTQWALQYLDHYLTEEYPTGRGAGFLAPLKNFPRVEHPEDLQFVMLSLWSTIYHNVEDIIYDEAEGVAKVIMQQPIWSSSMFSVSERLPHSSNVYFLEGAKELLNEPGEFFYDTREKMIYYYPHQDEDMTTAETYIGKTELLIDIQGVDKNDRAGNLVFNNLAFKYAKWDKVSYWGFWTSGQANLVSKTEGVETPEQYVKGNHHDAKATEALEAPGAVGADNAQNLSFTNCEFACLGATALDFVDSVSNVKIVGNIFRDLSGGAIALGAPWHATKSTAWEKAGYPDPVKNVLIKNNVMRRNSEEYYSNPTIMSYYDANIYIHNNDMKYAAYSIISAGMGYETLTLRSDFHKNISIKNNQMGYMMRCMEDGGTLYTLGDLGSCEVAYNYLYGPNFTEHAQGGLYCDAGTENYVAHDNVIAPDTGLWLHFQAGYHAQNDRYFNNYATVSEWDRTPADSDNVEIVQPTIITEDNIPEGAQKIIDGAGVEDAYKHLLNHEKIELPEGRQWQVDLMPWVRFQGAESFEPKYGWIQAENFLPGENGDAYYDTIDEKYNSRYRYDGVGIMDKSRWTLRDGSEIDGFLIHECGYNEYIKYNAYVPEDGYYDLRMIYGFNSDTGKTVIYVDDKLVEDTAPLTKTPEGVWGLGEMTLKTMYLEKGPHTITHVYYMNTGYHLDKIGFFKAGTPSFDDPVSIENSVDYMETTMREPDYRPEKKEFTKSVFKDIKRHYARTDIEILKAAGIMNGIAEDEFGLAINITVEQATWIGLRALKIDYTNENWEDVAVANGLLLERGIGKQAITKEQYAYLMAALYKKIGTTYSIKVGGGDAFNDMDAIKPEYRDAAIMGKAIGFTPADSKGNFNPSATMYRAEAAVNMAKFFRESIIYIAP